jgi:hypothetical protein
VQLSQHNRTIRESSSSGTVPGVLSAAKPLRAGSTAMWSRQQTRTSLKVAVKPMGAGHTEWIGNEQSALRQVRTSPRTVPRTRVHLLSGSLHPVVLQPVRRLGALGSLAVVWPGVGPILDGWSSGRIVRSHCSDSLQPVGRRVAHRTSARIGLVRRDYWREQRNYVAGRHRGVFARWPTFGE